MEPLPHVPAVSVVIPVYNMERYLRACLDSVVNQTLREIEIICVDDGSTDGSPGILKEYARRDNRISILTQSNNGLSFARNAGAKAATGTYLYFLDSDDYIDTTAMEQLYATAAAGDLDVLLFDGMAFYDSPALERKCPKERFNYSRKKEYGEIIPGRRLFAEMKTNGDYQVSSCLQFIKRSWLREAGLTFLEGILHEDQLFSFFCLMQANRAKHVKKQLFHRRFRENSTMTRKPSLENCKGCYTCYLAMLQFALTHEIEAPVAEAMVHELRWLHARAREIYSGLSVEERRITHPGERLLLEALESDEAGALQVRLAGATQELAETRMALATMRNSLSFRLGKTLLFVPQRIFEAVRRRNRS